MIKLVTPNFGPVNIPNRASRDHDSFREWILNADLPSKFSASFINGRIWVDTDVEEFFSHNLIKSELGRVLGAIVHDRKLGYFVSDGMLLTSTGARLSTEPDSMFVAYGSVREGRVSFKAGKAGTATEMVGAPDLVIEVVSRTTARKDTHVLKRSYFVAGVAEYWVIDARQIVPNFRVYERGTDRFTQSSEASGWWRSNVFDREFRVSTGTDPLGETSYILEHR